MIRFLDVLFAFVGLLALTPVFFLLSSFLFSPGRSFLFKVG